ncbi:MAG: hypothetical protein M3R24_23445 [Chloroflexota bacterium]|nr:hypothetical protein [Chloroflexota bacterium]
MSTDLQFVDPPYMRTEDSLPVRFTNADMIDMEKVTRHIAAAVTRGRYEGPQTPHEYLRNRHCVVVINGETYATAAGLLCFGRNPQEIYINGVVDLVQFSGLRVDRAEVLDLTKGVGGTLFEQIDFVEAYLWRNTRHGMTVTEDSNTRVELHEYPRQVIRELTVNLVGHRDYVNHPGATAQVQLFRDRIEWTAPGGLPIGVTEQNLLTAQNARNRSIMTILYEAGYVEAYGMGLDTVVTVLATEKMPAPRFEDHPNLHFKVTVFGRSVETRAASFVALSDSQQRILEIMRTVPEISRKELEQRLGDRAPRSVQRDLQTLLDEGLIDSNDARARAIRYRLRS